MAGGILSRCLACLLSSSLAWAGAERALGADDVRWLNRITYGIDSATVARYRELGRRRFLEEQLHPGDPGLDPETAAAIQALGISRKPLEQTLAEVEVENRRIQALPDEDARQAARQALNQGANQTAAEAARRHLLRALGARDQLKEQMAWFWLNHFNVFQGKANLRWSVADYEERALRPNVLRNLGAGAAALQGLRLIPAPSAEARCEELGPAWARTVVVVLSEFGRTFRENGTRGTDHGHGSVAWVLGGAVRGGRLVGEQVAVERATLFQDRDYPVLTDYRDLLGGLFKRLYGLSDAQVARVFPQSKALDLGLI